MLVQALGGLVFLGGLAYTAQTFRLSERGHIADRYTKAVEQPASQQRSVRAGGILALGACNRVLDLCSKRAFADWWTTTAAQQCFTKISAAVLDHRRF